MEGVFNRSLPDLNGGGSALAVPLTNTQFQFPAGNKFIVSPLRSSPVEDSGLLTRRHCGALGCQQLRGPGACGCSGNEEVLAR